MAGGGRATRLAFGGGRAPSFPASAGWQLSRGISTKAVLPTAMVPITSRATWPERFAGGEGGGTGRLPRSELLFGFLGHGQ